MKEKKQKSDAIEGIKKLLPAVLDKLFPVPIEKLKWCKGILLEDTEEIEGCRHISLYPQSCPIREQDSIEHFSREIISERVEEEDNTLGWRSELYVELKERESSHVKSFCLIALGNHDIKNLEDNILPKLDDCGVEYLIHRLTNQYDSLNELRLWIFCDTSIYLIAPFMKKIFGRTQNESPVVWESAPLVVPIFESDAVPIPGGYCLRNGTAGTVEFRGKTGNDSIFIMESILECKPVSEMQMLAAL